MPENSSKIKLKKRLSLPMIKQLKLSNFRETIKGAILPIDSEDRISVFVRKVQFDTHMLDTLHEERERFFENPEIQCQVEKSLSSLCTESTIKDEVHRIWKQDPKKFHRKNITKQDRELAIKSIKESNREQVTRDVERDNEKKK